jgi:hypothetical protein
MGERKKDLCLEEDMEEEVDDLCLEDDMGERVDLCFEEDMCFEDDDVEAEGMSDLCSMTGTNNGGVVISSLVVVIGSTASRFSPPGDGDTNNSNCFKICGEAATAVVVLAWNSSLSSSSKEKGEGSDNNDTFRFAGVLGVNK